MARNFSMVITGLEETKDRLSRLQQSFRTRRLMIDIGNYIMLKIKGRTSAGKDVNGTPFKPYNEKYKLFRQKKGHPTSRVNLIFSGSMLSAMTFSINAENDTVRVFFQNTEDENGVKNPLKAYFLNKEREFFALSNKEREDITGMIDYFIRRYSD